MLMMHLPKRLAHAKWSRAFSGWSWLVVLVLWPQPAAGQREASRPQPTARNGEEAGSEQAPTSSPSGAVEDRRRHLAEMGVDRWHAAGFRGKGVKVAVLDTGWRSYHDHLGKALPERVT